MLYLYHVNNFSYHELGSQVTIGRTTGDLVFNEDGRMSGRHAQLTFDSENHFIEDLGSKNRTIVNRVEIPPGQKIKIKHLTLLEIGAQQFIVTEVKNLSIQQLNDVMEHHMNKAVIKLEVERTKTGVKTPPLPVEEETLTTQDSIAAKEALLLQLQKDINGIEIKAKADLAKLEEQKEKIIADAKARRSELMNRAVALKTELEQQKEEAQKIRAELELKKKKIINLKDLPADLDEVSTEELPE